MWKFLVILVIAANVLLVTPSRVHRKKCRKNEVFDKCPAPCPPQECGIDKALILCAPPPKPGDPDCKPGCRCIDGYVRNKAGRCIPESKCPIKCPKNETLDACLFPCPPRQCGIDDNLVDCAPGPQPGDPDCKPGCRCSDGYARNSDGICVLRKDCPQCGDHEIYVECPFFLCRPLECSQVGYPVPCPVMGPYDYCPEGPACVCEEGYVRDHTGQCIPMQECPSCGGDPNAVSGCGTYCGTRCSHINNTEPVPCIEVCYANACDCREGYFYDDNTGKCVLPDDCTPVCRKNEVYDPCANGGNSKRMSSKYIDPDECIGDCVCVEGYLRNEDGICVPENHGYGPVCRENEVYDPCANGGCSKRKCSELSDPPMCTDPAECIGDCVCVEGYLRNEDGICVPEDQCYPECYGAHEVFSMCSNPCPPNTCESLDMAFICPIEWGQEDPCIPGCICETGYYRNSIGQCVTESECRKCMGPHEYFACDNACDNVCLTLNEQNHTNCPYINKRCTKMCYCEDGYARNEKNICIPIEDCPPSRCGPNEIYEENPSTVCEPQHCSEIGFPLDCPSEDEEPACICKWGYVRDENNVCIPKSECPSCGGDYNATGGCGTNCGRHCRDYGQDNIGCILMCYPNGCECKDNYWYDDNTGKCVLLEDCTFSSAGSATKGK